MVFFQLSLIISDNCVVAAKFLFWFQQTFFNPWTYMQTHTPTVIQEGGGWRAPLPPSSVFFTLRYSEKFYLNR